MLVSECVGDFNIDSTFNTTPIVHAIVHFIPSTHAIPVRGRKIWVYWMNRTRARKSAPCFVSIYIFIESHWCRWCGPRISRVNYRALSERLLIWIRVNFHMEFASTTIEAFESFAREFESGLQWSVVRKSYPKTNGSKILQSLCSTPIGLYYVSPAEKMSIHSTFHRNATQTCRSRLFSGMGLLISIFALITFVSAPSLNKFPSSLYRYVSPQRTIADSSRRIPTRPLDKSNRARATQLRSHSMAINTLVGVPNMYLLFGRWGVRWMLGLQWRPNNGCMVGFHEMVMAK